MGKGGHKENVQTFLLLHVKCGAMDRAPGPGGVGAVQSAGILRAIELTGGSPGQGTPKIPKPANLSRDDSRFCTGQGKRHALIYRRDDCSTQGWRS